MISHACEDNTIFVTRRPFIRKPTTCFPASRMTGAQWRIQDFSGGAPTPDWGTNLLLRPQRSCDQGYVFTRVCDSVNRWGVCLSACWNTTPGSRHTPQRRPPETSPGADTPPGSRHPHQSRQSPQQQTLAYGQWAASTHPTGMHSCLAYFLPKISWQWKRLHWERERCASLASPRSVNNWAGGSRYGKVRGSGAGRGPHMTLDWSVTSQAERYHGELHMNRQRWLKTLPSHNW